MKLLLTMMTLSILLSPVSSMAWTETHNPQAADPWQYKCKDGTWFSYKSQQSAATIDLDCEGHGGYVIPPKDPRDVEEYFMGNGQMVRAVDGSVVHQFGFEVRADGVVVEDASLQEFRR